MRTKIKSEMLLSCGVTRFFLQINIVFSRNYANKTLKSFQVAAFALLSVAK